VITGHIKELTMNRLAWMALLLVAAIGLLGCGESAEETALTEVCDARAEIQQQVDELQSATVATVTVDQVRGNLEAIQAELQQMIDATDELAEARREEVEQGTEAFRSSIDDALSGLGQTQSLQAGRAQVSAAIDDVARSYEEALEPIECP
jgi:DNA anti-recombination protein RmuC